MAEWTVCPFCQLKHSRRADGLCPRCKQSIDVGGASPPTVAPEPVLAPAAGPVAGIATGRTSMPDVYDGSVPLGSAATATRRAPVLGAATSDAVPLGARIAGGIMLVNAVLVFAESSLTSMGSLGIRSTIIDLIVGGGLVFGSERMLIWAKVRVVLGAIVFTMLAATSSGAFVAFLQIGFSACLLALLFGNAGKVRIGIAGALIGIYFLLELLGLYALSHQKPGEEASSIASPAALVQAHARIDRGLSVA